MIRDPIEYSDADSIIVSNFQGKAEDEQTGSYWGDEELSAIKSRIKTHYIRSQRNRCCYCNMHLRTDNHRSWDVEHIVSRSSHPRFMFEPKNLAASCPDCNTSKSDANVLLNSRRKTYPSKSKDFKIVHPHVDNYEDHIYMKGFVYIGKTEKGKWTIYKCDLLRFAQKYIDWSNSAVDNRFEDAVDAVFEEDGHASKNAVDQIIDSLPQV